MKRIVIGVTLGLSAILLTACGATDDTPTVTVDTPAAPSNVTDESVPVTNYKNDAGYDVQVWTITENGHECIIAISVEAVALQCEGMETP